VKNERQHSGNTPCLSSHFEEEPLDAGSPLAQIIGVKRRGVKGTSADVEVELALEPARGRASRYWRLALKADYADGAVNSQIITSTEALTRNPLVTVPALSTRDRRSSIVGFRAYMTVNFAEVTSIMRYEEFAMPRPEDDIHQRVTEPIEIRPHVVILDTRPVGDASLRERFIEVKWGACAPVPAMIERFDICLDVAHADGLTHRARKSVDARCRRTLIAVAPHSATIASVGVGLSATVAWYGSSAKDVDEAFGY
jgi:hypothetical protein